MAFELRELTSAGVSVLDCEHKTPKAADSGFPYIAIPDVQDGRVILETARRISDDDLQEWTRRTVPQPGDIVVTRRARVGDTAPIPAGIQCAIGQNLVLLRSDGSCIDQSYLRWAVRSPQWWSEVDRLMNVGAVFSSLNVRDIAKIRVPVPQRLDQVAIAQILGALDDKIAANTKLAGTASALAGLLYDQEAAGVGNQPMSQILTPVLGGTPSRSKREEFWGGNRPWASAKDITGADFGVVTDTAETITDLAVQTTRAKPLPSGSVVLTARGTVGAVARLAVPSSFNQSCYGFVPGLIPAAVLYFAVLRATERAKEIAHGSVFDTITMKTFDHLSFPEFDSTQLAATEAILAPLMESVTAAVVENKTLAATRDALLPQLMSGKLRVKDAEKVLEDAGV